MSGEVQRESVGRFQVGLRHGASTAVGVREIAEILFATFTVYVVVPLAKAMVDVLRVKLKSEASEEGARVADTTYVSLLTWLAAVTKTVRVVVAPSTSARDPDAAPLVTLTPLTVTVAAGCCVVGVSVRDATLFATLMV